MQNFVLITGPIAVGKMTVGQELHRRLGYPLLHNHHSIELALDLADHGTPEFKKINEGIRQLVFETMAKSKTVPGFIFTLVWAFDYPEDWAYVADLRKQFEREGWRFYIVELSAPLEERVLRNKTENRLRHKASKRDVSSSEAGLHHHEERFMMNSGEKLPAEKDYVRIDNTQLSPAQVAEEISAAFGFTPIEK